MPLMADTHSSARPARERPLWSARGSLVSVAHTVLGASAFLMALGFALALHYRRVVKNGVAGWPDEWWPSVSATIGDWYPERNVFQIFIAMTSGPRFLLVTLCSLVVALKQQQTQAVASAVAAPKQEFSAPQWPQFGAAPWTLALVGVLRTVSCGGWVYITSSDDHDVHDVAMGMYIALTIPWMATCIAFLPDGNSNTTPTAQTSDQPHINSRQPWPSDRPRLTGRRLRSLACAAFFGCTPFMVYFYYQHKVLEVPGMYSIYSCFEWGLIVTDIAFDAASFFDLRHITFHLGYVTDPDTDLDATMAFSVPSTLPSEVQTEVREKNASASADTDELACAESVPSWRTNLALLSDVYWQFIFWTSTTSVLPVLFFFSVYNLAIGGEEAVVLLQTLAFGMLCLPFLRKLFFHNDGGIRLDLAGVPVQGIQGPDRASGLFTALLFLEIPALASWSYGNAHGRLWLTATSAAAAAIRVRLEWAHAAAADELATGLGATRAGKQAALRGQIARWMAGLVLTMLAKYACFGNHPLAPFMRPTSPHAGNPMGISPDMLRLGMNNGEGTGEGPHGGWNRLGLILTLLAFAERISRPSNTLHDAAVGWNEQLLNQPKMTSTTSATDLKTTRETVEKSAALAPSPSWMERSAMVLGTGAILYALPMYLSDSGTLISWTWTGYPIQGPEPLKHGWVVLGLFALGIALAARPYTALPRSMRHKAVNPYRQRFWYGLTAILTLSLLIVYRVDNWAAFPALMMVPLLLPSLVMHILLKASISPPLGSHVSANPFSAAAAAWFVCALLTFLQVLTVAYAFVPVIGPLMRERSGTMILVSQLCLFAAAMWRSQADSEAEMALGNPPTNNLQRQTSSNTSKQGTVSAKRDEASDDGSPDAPTITESLPRSTKFLLLLLLLMAFLGLPIPIWHKPVIEPPDSVQTRHRAMTVGIHTVHFGLDQDMYESGTRLSDLYMHMGLDVVGMLETDLQRVVYGNRDLSQWLAYKLGMYVDPGPGPQKHTWGVILLSRFPIINTTHHLLPSPHGELAPAIQAWLDVYGVEVMVWVSHNGQEEDFLDRTLQTTEIARHLSASYPHPAVFLGYLVTRPHAPRPAPYTILAQDGKMLDVDPDDQDRWCQYIFFRAVERMASARVSRYTVSDTELQTAKFRIPPVGYLIDPDRDDRTVRVREAGFPMPLLYYPDLYDPWGLVYAKHMYFPSYLPFYYANPDRRLLDYPPRYTPPAVSPSQ